jgi:hypothetical protein
MDTSTKGKLTRELMSSHKRTKQNIDYMYICAYTVIEITFFYSFREEKRTLEPSSPKVPCIIVLGARYATSKQKSIMWVLGKKSN